MARALGSRSRCSTTRSAVNDSMGKSQTLQRGLEISEKTTRSGSSKSLAVPTVLRLFRERSERVTAKVGGRFSSRSNLGLSNRARNCRA